MPGAAPISKRQQKREKATKQKLEAEKKPGLQLDFTCTKLPNRVYVEPDKQHPALMIESWLSHKRDAVSLFYGQLDARAGDCVALMPDPNCQRSISASLGQVLSNQSPIFIIWWCLILILILRSDCIFEVIMKPLGRHDDGGQFFPQVADSAHACRESGWVDSAWWTFSHQTHKHRYGTFLCIYWRPPPVIFYNHWSIFLVFLKSLSRRLGWYAFSWAWDLAWWNFGGAMRGDDSWDACAVWKPQLFEGLPGKIFVFRTQGTSTVASELSWQLPSVLNLGGFVANSARHYAICSGWKIEMLFFPPDHVAKLWQQRHFSNTTSSLVHTFEYYQLAGLKPCFFLWVDI